MISHPGLPRLTAQNHRISSPQTTDCNCVAWSAGDTEHWWQPGVYWPVLAASDEYGVEALAQAFEALGYDSCSDGVPEPGFEKVALYSSGPFYTHAARHCRTASGRANSGRWKTSSTTHQTMWVVGCTAKWRGS
jgi:hypothetical protein